MNKIIKSGLMLFGAVLAFSACTDDYEYDGFAKVAGNQVYFDKNKAVSDIELDVEATSFPITLGRAVSTEAITVPLSVTKPDNSIFTIPTQASFAAGESTTTINVTYNPADIVYGNYETITLALGDSTYSTPYGLSSYTFNVGKTAWVDYGIAQYREDCMTTWFTVDNVVYDVAIQKNTIEEGVYRLVNVYGGAYPYNTPDDYDGSKDYYMTINASDPDMVYVIGGYTGMDWSYGEVWLTSYVDYYLRTGKTIDEVKSEHPELFGKLEDNVITFPSRSFLISMDDYNDGGLYYANNNGMLAIALPGGVIADYAVAAQYEGKFVAADGSEQVLAGGMFGEDIASAKAFLVQDKLTLEALTAILNGETEGADMSLSEIEDEDYVFSGSVYLPMAADAPTGTYTIVVVGYDADGEAQEYDYTEFKYQNPSDSAPTYSPWAKGDYTYTLFFADEDEEGNVVPYVDEGLLISRGDSNPNRFKVEHWGYDVDFYFEFQEDGSILVDDQETGYVHSSVGMIYVDDLVDYTGGTEYGQSYYDEETGTFHFAVIYYYADSQAHSVGFGEETLQVTGAAANARFAEAKRKAMADGFKGKSVSRKMNKMDRKRINPMGHTPVLSRLK